MGRLFLVDLADSNDPETHLIVCRTCHTHIAHRQHIIPSIWAAGYWLGLTNIVNLQVDGAEQYKAEGMYTLADVRCVKCGDRLGVKCIKDETPWILPGHISNNGTYHLMKAKLDHWTLAHQYRNVALADFV